MRQKQLEMMLQRVSGYKKPRAELEQYQTPATLAARLLYHAMMKGDISGKSVCDLGCGTGILAIGAVLLGASEVRGFDIDPDAVAAAEKNAAMLEADAEFTVADIRNKDTERLVCTCDTIVMNPPFGAQRAHADRPFIDLALSAATVTYGIFNAGSLQFLEAYTAQRGEITEKIGGAFPIKRTFFFHTKDVQEIEVEIVRLTQKTR